MVKVLHKFNFRQYQNVISPRDFLEYTKIYEEIIKSDAILLTTGEKHAVSILDEATVLRKKIMSLEYFRNK